MSARREPGVPSLVIEDSTEQRRTVPLDRNVTQLGRRNDNDVQLMESHVSKRHADIQRRGDRYVVVDVGSKAGVYVNGIRVVEEILQDGDVITLGSTPLPSLMFHRNGAGGSPPPVREFLATLTTVPEAGPGAATSGLESLAKFLEFSRLSSGALQIDEILDNVVDLATEITGAERGFLITAEAGGSLEYRVARHRDRSPIPASSAAVTETIVREVLESGETRMVSDVREFEDLADLQSVVALHLGSIAALPLRRFAMTPGGGRGGAPRALASRGEVFGVLYLDSREKSDAFSRVDRGILETLARDASSVIENARLFRESEDRARLHEEMERAREVQAALLPQSFWQEPHFEVAGTCLPARQLGGDYLDQFRLDGGRCCLVMADVSGKGVAAALLAAALQGMLATEITTEQALGTLVGRVNRATCRVAPVGTFVTFFCCVLGPEGDLRYVNAGHPPPMIVGAGGTIVRLATGGMALGIRDGIEYREERRQLQPGDAVLLYTDGVTEAVNAGGDLFGDERLDSVAVRSRRNDAEEILGAALQEVRDFSGEVLPRDDVTLMVLKYKGPRSAGGKAPEDTRA